MSPDLIITNALVVSCDRDHTLIENGAVAIEGNTITRVGASQDVVGSESAGVEVVDAGGKILMPGLINMHAHCGDALFRGLVENLPLEEWLQQVWKAQGAILDKPENSQIGSQLGMVELLLGGTTCVMDNFWNADQTFAAAKKIGIRIATGGLFFDSDGMDGKNQEYRPDLAKQLFEQYGNDEEVFVGTMPHGAYTVDPENLKVAVDMARENDGFFSVHAAETRVEQQTVQERYGTSVIRHLHNLGGLSDRTVLAHCVHVNEEEIDLIAQTGTHVAHNPLSNMKLASGFAPVAQMIDKGVNVTLGTDGAISGNDMDMWLAMRLAAIMHKGYHEDPSLFSTGQILHMATLNGAKALGAQDRLGSIEAGKRADIILLDIDKPHAFPMFNPVNHLVFSASKNDVCDVFVSGRQVVKNRTLLTVDVASLLSEVARLQPQILAALEA